MTDKEVPDEFQKVMKDFYKDILISFPEYKEKLGPNEVSFLMDQDDGFILFSYCKKIYPERFFDGLLDSCTVVRRQSYSDHYQFNSKDVADWVACIRSEKLDAIVTTAKDAVRIKPYTQELKGIALIVIPIEVRWHEKDAIEKFVDKWLESTIFATETAKEIDYNEVDIT